MMGVLSIDVSVGSWGFSFAGGRFHSGLSGFPEGFKEL